MINGSTDDLLTLLPVWDRYFSHLTLPVVLPAADRDVVLELRMRIINLRRRLRDGPLAPLRVAFFGPTGSGKSKLFSSLIGNYLSGSGYHRPYTRRAVYYLHDAWKAIASSLAGEVHFHVERQWQHALLIDTPDFDSVEVDNRLEAERVFLEADSFLFVTDALKYADASTWEYLRRIRASRKDFFVVLNKVNADSVVASFNERYAATFGTDVDVTRIVIPELPLADDELIPASHPAVLSLREAALSLSVNAGSQTSARMFQQEGQGIISSAEYLGERTRALQQQFTDLETRNQQRIVDAKRRLEQKLTTGIGPEVREEVYQRVLRRLERIDILRYPRKLLTLPFRGMKALETAWLPGAKGEAKPAPEPADPVTSETFHLLEAEIIRLADDARLDWTSQPEIEPLLNREMFQSLRMSHGEVERRFTQHYEGFKEWLAIHAKETAAKITTENKAKFFVSQVLFNTLLITAQVHTGGALSFVELGMDGLISPFVAKAVGMAIGNEKVRAFELEAHAFHQRSLGKIIEEAADRFQRLILTSRASLDELASLVQQIVDHRRELQKLIADFQFQAARSGNA